MHITVPITVCLRQHKNLKALGLRLNLNYHTSINHTKNKNAMIKKLF